MSDNTEQVEQITKVPSNASSVPKREKDPKRVAAGKKLAENNKRMREEHARFKALEAQRVVEAPRRPRQQRRKRLKPKQVVICFQN